VNRLISKTEKFVRKNLEGYDSGHDWHHIDRVRKLALYIGSREGAGDRFIIELSALLHDTGDRVVPVTIFPVFLRVWALRVRLLMKSLRSTDTSLSVL
jgi:hypothetical protein